MTKVKILSANYADVLERMINEFSARYEISDIRFSTTCHHAIYYSAMIIYEEV